GTKTASTGTNGATTRWRRVRGPVGRCPCLRLQETDRESLCRAHESRGGMAKLDRRTLTNQPDPPDCGKTIPKRVRTQIHRRTKTAEPLAEQWDAGSGRTSGSLRKQEEEMGRQ